MNTKEARNAVFEEMARFDEALPQLLKELRGRWVVFKDGQVLRDFPTEIEAYQFAIGELGPRGGQVVAQVVEREAVPKTASVLFGMA